jgi:hypothetical protein
LYSSPSIIRINKSEGMRLAGHVARIWRIGIDIAFWLENQKEKTVRWIVLKWISER